MTRLYVFYDDRYAILRTDHVPPGQRPHIESILKDFPENLYDWTAEEIEDFKNRTHFQIPIWN